MNEQYQKNVHQTETDIPPHNRKWWEEEIEEQEEVKFTDVNLQIYVNLLPEQVSFTLLPLLKYPWVNARTNEGCP